MSGKHFRKYLQKYHIFLSAATTLGFLYACSTTKKVPDGDYLLVDNNFIYPESKVHSDELEDYVSQKPNKKSLFVLPVGLWAYNLANPKYDTILTEYMTYPSEIRNQKLRDSLFIKYDMPEEVGKNLFVDRFLHTIGQPPVILDQSKTESSAENIRKRLVYRGYWDAQVDYKHNLDSAAKKATVDYLVEHKDPTYISEYYYDIPDPNIKSLYEEQYRKSHVLSGQVLDQTNLEDEVRRITQQMRDEGYYRFNSSNEEIYFTADTLLSRKQVPLVMDIRKDSLGSPYKKSTIGDIKVYVLETLADVPDTEKDSLRGINFYKLDNQYKTRALWRPIILAPGETYSQRNFDLTKRNINAMNNFSLISYEEDFRKNSDSIIDVAYYLAPLPKYDLRTAMDVSYSQILNFGLAPSVDLTSRNVFGGAENLTLGVSGIFGAVKNSKDPEKRSLAYEASAQATLNFPRLLLPVSYYKLIPKRYSPTSNINMGVSIQDNIGLGRITFNTGLNYFANVNDIVNHRLSIFNTQLSLTRNKERYYEYFPREGEYRDQMFQTYSPELYNQFLNEQITSDEVSSIIIQDKPFQEGLEGDGLDLFNNFRQSLINKDRQTQDVLISSIIYNFIYNEIGKKDRFNPFYFNGKIETAGNLLGLVAKQTQTEGIASQNTQKTLFDIPYSQFVKVDLDVRKYFQFFEGKHTLALRQFIGVGIPYGNSTSMPFIRSYFNGGSNDIRAWRVFGGLGPADSQLDERIRAYVMDNIKLTTNVEYRMPFTEMFEGAAFVDAGNIWNLKDSGFGDEFRFNKFLSQMGVGAGLGLRVNVAYITLRLDAAWKVHDPNRPLGERWVISKWQPLKPTINFAFGYPF
ncbi:translocation and assembly module lipoprotein TamL [Planobacterium oryzisoli]|uniref:BamA/TamA family outer membrane protein n=1 Tax=Planobacterium oryzisoli TaxID=2771435 RepID=A0A930YU37_9FLAO|nr:BamA/TamA family outer membrane protein [Planobacterium oryzisoli]MBF5026389.1 BamA/TamA family outer membrane protein [Planobacterium oryzisoli]